MSYTLAEAPARSLPRPAAVPPRAAGDAVTAVPTLTALHAAVAAQVESADPGPAAPGGWEQRERLRVSTWVRQMYDHELGPLALAAPSRDTRRAQAAELGDRIDVGLLRTRPAVPSGHSRAVAAVAAMWEVTADALGRTPRPPREQVVRDVWGLVRELIAPVREPYSSKPFDSRVRW